MCNLEIFRKWQHSSQLYVRSLLYFYRIAVLTFNTDWRQVFLLRCASEIFHCLLNIVLFGGGNSIAVVVHILDRHDRNECPWCFTRSLWVDRLRCLLTLDLLAQSNVVFCSLIHIIHILLLLLFMAPRFSHCLFGHLRHLKGVTLVCETAIKVSDVRDRLHCVALVGKDRCSCACCVWHVRRLYVYVEEVGLDWGNLARAERVAHEWLLEVICRRCHSHRWWSLVVWSCCYVASVTTKLNRVLSSIVEIRLLCITSCCERHIWDLIC